MRNRGIGKTIGVVIAALAVISTIIYFAVQPSIGRPDEKKRIKHVAGFSLVRPEGWDSTLSYSNAEGAGNRLYTGDPKSGRQARYIQLEQLPVAPDLEELKKQGYAPSEFQGQPAMKQETEHKQTYYLRYQFDRHGTWYLLTLSRSLLPPLSEFVPFMESAHFDKATSKPDSTIVPTSMPTIVPTTAPTPVR